MTQELKDLRESVELENRADLFAAACDFGNASHYMRQANKLRQARFGKLDPNELRKRTRALLKGQGK